MSALPASRPAVVPALRTTQQVMRAAFYAVALLVVGPVVENGLITLIQALAQ